MMELLLSCVLMVAVCGAAFVDIADPDYDPKANANISFEDVRNSDPEFHINFKNKIKK